MKAKTLLFHLFDDLLINPVQDIASGESCIMLHTN